MQINCPICNQKIETGDCYENYDSGTVYTWLTKCKCTDKELLIEVRFLDEEDN